ncbi:hypothetical protein Y032_0033g2642 [Ancylostoma ceylanicum]|uniref:Uncharacterized protein n=1 Tax=Ancylostoma ceylanicum TaxID=53326 RepID=A0A016UNG7_9BILA|nr:hypothetical protein Y032_0033g2642 [Ancylostoma ceylanicum]
MKSSIFRPILQRLIASESKRIPAQAARSRHVLSRARKGRLYRRPVYIRTSSCKLVHIRTTSYKILSSKLFTPALTRNAAQSMGKTQHDYAIRIARSTPIPEMSDDMHHNTKLRRSIGLKTRNLWRFSFVECGPISATDRRLWNFLHVHMYLYTGNSKRPVGYGLVLRCACVG